MAADLPSLVDDLVAESAALDAVLERLRPPQWSLSTLAAGWTVGDQVSHLAYFDEATLQSLTDPDQFRREAEVLTSGGDGLPDRIAAQHRGRPGAGLLSWFRDARAALVAAYRTVDPGRRLPWYGPDMSPASSVTARLMETWAHGQDILDVLDIDRAPTARLRHIADLGIRAAPYSYAVNRLPSPKVPIRVELSAPDGDVWTWGPPDARDRVVGSAMDFCLVVTQRKHRDDSGLVVTGPTAQQWIAIAQAFAGPAGPGRAPQAVGSGPGGLDTRVRELGGPQQASGCRPRSRSPSDGKQEHDTKEER
ncbi:MAG: TIGR03084 family metal-binding protein [Acidimicrobiales bacterium]|jgi:uncharacterized protein (TIGR03084 family)